MRQGPEAFSKILFDQRKDSFWQQQLESTKVKNLVLAACARKGLRLGLAESLHVQCDATGITINTTTPTIANRLKQIQPTIEKTLFDAGVTAPIVAIRSGKISTLTPAFDYPMAEPRVAPKGASEAVLKEAAKAKDPEIEAALRRLAQALK